MDQQETQLQVTTKRGNTKTSNNYIISQMSKIYYMPKGMNGLGIYGELTENL